MIFFVKLILLYFITFQINAHNHWLKAFKPFSLTNKRKRYGFKIKMNIDIKSDILTTFENDCKTCYFKDKIYNLKRNEIVDFTFYNDTFIIKRFNDYTKKEEVILTEKNPKSCFFCIQKNFRLKK